MHAVKRDAGDSPHWDGKLWCHFVGAELGAFASYLDKRMPLSD